MRMGGEGQRKATQEQPLKIGSLRFHEKEERAQILYPLSNQT